MVYWVFYRQVDYMSFRFPEQVKWNGIGVNGTWGWGCREADIVCSFHITTENVACVRAITDRKGVMCPGKKGFRCL